MNKSRYVPFERNRYFYGKLLTVRDFMSEQTYNSDKHRLSNRLLFGSGVVSGLQVVAVDDKSISMETGVALDKLGREIVVASPVTIKLSNVDGFTNNDYAKNVYLCIAYDEKGKEPVHTVGGGVGASEEVSEHNRILESYRIYITEQAPKPQQLEYDYLIEDTWSWYDDGQVRIYQQLPRYVEYGQSFELKLVIEKTLQTPPVSFQYELELEHADIIDGLVDGKVVFSEPTDANGTRYEKIITLRAHPANGDEKNKQIQLSSVSSSAKLVIGERLLYELSQPKQTVQISRESVAERILHAYYARPLDQAMEAPSDPCIYIAQINLLQMGASYVIDKVIQQPFHDYVVNPTLLYKMLLASNLSAHEHVEQTVQEESVKSEEQIIPFPTIEEEFARLIPPQIEELEEQQVITGIAEISIEAPKKLKWYHRKQRRFISEEIEHGFDVGLPVLLTLALSDEDGQSNIPVPEMWKRSDTIVVGDKDVFKGSEYELDFPKVSLAHIQYPSKGSFRIGVKVNQKTERLRLRVRWWAVKAVEEEAAGLAAEAIEQSHNSAATGQA
ncbi:MAG TPA: hypothetical protein IAA29_15980 [Candidatus Paenibacillus intestinavium]|nr:hypothetical protein [Candidatus Paenibacillus intestinavium]